jgi:23S rRNA pseudouridine1911/1915/1917 synthase
MDWVKLKIPSYYNLFQINHFLMDMQVSKKKIILLEKDQLVKVNGIFVPFSSLLKTDDELEIALTQDQVLDYEPDTTEAKILYEDDFVLVVDKPANMIIYSDDFSNQHTLANQVACYYQNHHLDLKVRHLHRLDKDTTGAIMYAKNSLSHAYYSVLWNSKTITRKYMALVEGQFEKSNGVINLPIGKDRHKNNHYLVLQNGKQAVTHYQVIKQLEEISLIEFTLETGRTHQIRVHMNYLKHPLLGDKEYGSKIPSPRVMLHSSSITFFHPLKRDYITVLSPIPGDMNRFI